MMRETARVAVIAAMDRNRAIGARNTLPWHLPEDLKRFRTLTLGQPVIMGRKTHLSIGRPLPGRLNLVVSRDAGLVLPGVETVTSLESALARAKAELSRSGAAGAKVWVIGGGEIYRQALAIPGAVDEIHLTEVDLSVEGADATFPEWDLQQWREAECSEWLQSAGEQALRYRYRSWVRG